MFDITGAEDDDTIATINTLNDIYLTNATISLVYNDELEGIKILDFANYNEDNDEGFVKNKGEKIILLKISEGKKNEISPEKLKRYLYNEGVSNEGEYWWKKSLLMSLNEEKNELVGEYKYDVWIDNKEYNIVDETTGKIIWDVSKIWNDSEITYDMEGIMRISNLTIKGGSAINIDVTLSIDNLILKGNEKIDLRIADDKVLYAENIIFVGVNNESFELNFDVSRGNVVVDNFDLFGKVIFGEISFDISELTDKTNVYILTTNQNMNLNAENISILGTLSKELGFVGSKIHLISATNEEGFDSVEKDLTLNGEKNFVNRSYDEVKYYFESMVTWNAKILTENENEIDNNKYINLLIEGKKEKELFYYSNGRMEFKDEDAKSFDENGNEVETKIFEKFEERDEEENIIYTYPEKYTFNIGSDTGNCNYFENSTTNCAGVFYISKDNSLPWKDENNHININLKSGGIAFQNGVTIANLDTFKINEGAEIIFDFWGDIPIDKEKDEAMLTIEKLGKVLDETEHEITLNLTEIGLKIALFDIKNIESLSETIINGDFVVMTLLRVKEGDFKFDFGEEEGNSKRILSTYITLPKGQVLEEERILLFDVYKECDETYSTEECGEGKTQDEADLEGEKFIKMKLVGITLDRRLSKNIPADKLKQINESVISATIVTNGIANFIEDDVMKDVVYNKNTLNYKNNDGVFFSSNAGYKKVNTGSHVESYGFNFALGINNYDVFLKNLTFAYFLETGYNSFKTTNKLDDGEKIGGTGNNIFFGIGSLLHYKMALSDVNNIAFEGSVNTGVVNTQYGSEIAGLEYRNLSTNFMGGHIGATYSIRIERGIYWDNYVKYLYNINFASKMNLNETNEYNTGNVVSKRVKAGFTYNNANEYYYGAAVEIEQNGESGGKYYEANVRTTSLKGITYSVNFGLQNIMHRDLTYNLKTNVFYGKRIGGDFGLTLKYNYD
jgi:hypothetical protein